MTHVVKNGETETRQHRANPLIKGEGVETKHDAPFTGEAIVQSLQECKAATCSTMENLYPNLY